MSAPPTVDLDGDLVESFNQGSTHARDSNIYRSVPEIPGPPLANLSEGKKRSSWTEGDPEDRLRENRKQSIRAVGETRLGKNALYKIKRMSRSRRKIWMGLMRDVPDPEKQPLINGGHRKKPVTPPVDEDNESTLSVWDEIFFGKILGVLLLFIPLAWASHHYAWGASYVFWFNFLAMIPLASYLGDFTEIVSAHTSQSIGGLINATFGNAVEVVVAVQALNAGEIRVVKASMLGSIFSNLLLVLGSCFFFGGLKKDELTYNSTITLANVSLLALSSIALFLPTPIAAYNDADEEEVLAVSRAAAILLFFMYMMLLVFQLKTHAHLLADEEEEDTHMSMCVALTGLVIMTAAIALLSDWLVQSIDEFSTQSGISKTFVGMIILPVVGNAVEHMTAVSVSMKGKIDLAMAVAVGSATQICLFVLPFIVIYGWIFGEHVTLNYPVFEFVLYILSLWIVTICLSSSKGNWLLGVLLITTYAMLGIAFWYEKVDDVTL